MIGLQNGRDDEIDNQLALTLAIAGAIIISIAAVFFTL